MSRLYKLLEGLNIHPIKEAVQADGATLIGTGKGYDVFKIDTFQGAQNFVDAGDELPAGEVFIYNEKTFNANIDGDNVCLYFFVEENTNKVVYSLVVTKNEKHLINFENGNQNTVNITCNFMCQGSTIDKENKIQDIIPIYLISDINASQVEEGGLLITGEALNGVLGYFTPETTLEELDLTNKDTLKSINPITFEFGVSCNNLKLPYIEALKSKIDDKSYTLNNVRNITMADPPLTFIYKVVGNEVHIIAAKPSAAEKLNKSYYVPDRIEDKPITVIEPHAFSDIEINNIRLPLNTLKRIEREAFYGSRFSDKAYRYLLDIYQDPKGKIILGKNVFGNTTIH